MPSGSYANRWPFNSSTGRTFGSPYSGYRGDYSVYPDETWKQGLRRYAYQPPTSPARRPRSASPRRRSASAKAASQRQVLTDILSKINGTQEDLHSLAAKVSRWSREAASLAGGLQEEALLLELSRQADRLAAAEASHGELAKRERVVRLGRENGLLRDELRDMIRICKLLLDRDQIADAAAAAAAAPPARPASAAVAPPPPRPLYAAAAAPRLAAPAARVTTQTSPSLYYGSEDPYGALYGGGPYDDLADAEEEAALEALMADVGVDAMTEEEVAAAAAADSAAAQAEAEAQVATAVAVAARGGVAAEMAARAAEFEVDMRRDKRQVGAALAAVDEALAELNSHFPVGVAAAAAAPLTTRTPPPPPSTPAFGGFTTQAAAARARAAAAATATAEITPAPAAAPAAAPQRVGDGDGAVERFVEGEGEGYEEEEEEEGVAVGTPMGTPVKLAEGIPASAPATPIYQGIITGTAAAAAAAAGGAAEGVPVVAQGLPTAAAPDTIRRGGGASGAATTALPQQVSLGVPAAASAAAAVASPTPAVSYPSVAAANAAVMPPPPPPAAAPSAATPGAAALDTLLLAEVEKLKRVNRALAGTLQSYGRVTDRLGGAAAASVAASVAASPAAAGLASATPTARALFSEAYLAGMPSAPAPVVPLTSTPAWYSYGYASNHTSPYTSSSYPVVHNTTTSYASPRSSLRFTAPLTPAPPPPLVSYTPAPIRSAATAAVGSSPLYGEIRSLDSNLDGQLYDIRQQLHELRRDLATDRLAATAATAAGGSGSATASAALARAAAAASPPPPSFPLYTSPYGSAHDAVQIARIKDEISDLRRQITLDKAWYFNSLDHVVTERSTMFTDLQRRIDVLLAPRPFY